MCSPHTPVHSFVKRHLLIRNAIHFNIIGFQYNKSRTATNLGAIQRRKTLSMSRRNESPNQSAPQHKQTKSSLLIEAAVLAQESTKCLVKTMSGLHTGICWCEQTT